jgi:hypothetical protein
MPCRKQAGGFLPIGTRLDNPNFADMAQAMGIYGVRVDICRLRIFTSRTA